MNAETSRQVPQTLATRLELVSLWRSCQYYTKYRPD